MDFAFDSSVRSFRRGYALEFLTVFYNNGRLVHLDTKHLDIRMKMEKKLCKNAINTLKELYNTNKTENEQSIQCNGSVGKEVKQRYVWLLLSLLRSIRTQHLSEAWNWEEIGNVLTQFKINVTLTKNAKAAYNKLATEIGIPLHT